MTFLGTDRYFPIRLLGSGGTGEVYEVEDRELGIKVALKVLYGVGGHALIRFKHEFRALCDIHHDNLVQFYEMGSDQDRWFITMELVDGVDLISYVCPKPIWAGEDGALDGPGLITSPVSPVPSDEPPYAGYDEGRLFDSFKQLVRGLCVLHDEGLVHRDLKPGNVLVTKSGRVVILDFGQVREGLKSESSGSGLSGVAGTVEYMAPELAAENPVGPAADWYSVGVLLYQALTGRLPFDGPPLDILLRKQVERPVHPQAINPDCHPDLAALAMGLLDPDPHARAGRDDLTRLLGGRGRRAETSIQSWTVTLGPPDVFVGRDEELASLSAAWSRVWQDEARTVLIVEGESGIGKTRLMESFLDDVTSGDSGAEGIVLAGRCFERESMAYKAFDAVVDRLSVRLSRLSAEELSFLLPENIWYLVGIFPALNRIRLINESRYRRADGGDPLVARRLAFSSFWTLLSRLSMGKPVLVSIDDLQWADADSMEMLEAITEQGGRQDGQRGRVMVVATMRPKVAGEWVQESLDRLRKNGVVETLRLEPLRRDDSHALVTHLLSSSSSSRDAATVASRWVDVIVDESGGNPFLMGEMAQFVRLRQESGEELPSETLDLSKVMAQRIAGLPAGSLDILAHVAVAGQPIAQDLLADAVGMSVGSPQWRRNVTRLRALRLVRFQGFKGRDIIEMYHDRVRQAVLDLLEPQERRSVHADLARAMERTRGVEAEALARHWLAAGYADRAKDYLVRAAGDSVAKLAFGRAVRLYSTAIELETDEQTRYLWLMELGNALVNDGRPAEAALAFSRASASSSAPVRLRALVETATNRIKAGYIRQGLDALDAVFGEFDERVPGSGLPSMLAVVLSRFLLKRRGLEFEPRDRMDVSEKDLTRLEVLWSLASSFSLVDPVLSAVFHAKLWSNALELGLSDYVSVALAIEAGSKAALGSSGFAEAHRLVANAEGLASACEDIRFKGRIVLTRGIIAYFSGDWSAAEEFTRKALDLFRNRAHGTGWEVSASLSFLSWSLLMQGKMKELGRLADREMDQAARRGDRLLRANLPTTDAMLWLAQDRVEEVEWLIDDAVSTWPNDRIEIQHFYVVFARTDLLLYQGKAEQAWELLEKEVPRLKRALLTRIGVVRQELLRAKGRVALTLAAGAGSLRDRKYYLRAVAGAVKGLRKEKIPFIDAWAEHLVAGKVWVAERNPESATEAFAQAAGMLEAAGLGFHALAARRRLAVISGDAAGLRDVDDEMQRLGVVRPDRIMAVLSPGDFSD